MMVDLILIDPLSNFPSSLGGSLMYQSLVVLLDCFLIDTIISIDVIRVNSYVDSFLHSSGLPV